MFSRYSLIQSQKKPNNWLQNSKQTKNILLSKKLGNTGTARKTTTRKNYFQNCKQTNLFQKNNQQTTRQPSFFKQSNINSNALGNANQRQKSFAFQKKHTTNIFQKQATNKPSFLQNNNTNKTNRIFQKPNTNKTTNIFQKQANKTTLFQPKTKQTNIFQKNNQQSTRKPSFFKQSNINTNALGNANQRHKSFTLERRDTTNIFQNQATHRPSFLQNHNTNKTTRIFQKPQANKTTNIFQKQQKTTLFQPKTKQTNIFQKNNQQSTRKPSFFKQSNINTNALGNANQRHKSFTLERRDTTNIFQNQATHRPSFLQNNNTNKTTRIFQKPQANKTTNIFQKQQKTTLFQQKTKQTNIFQKNKQQTTIKPSIFKQSNINSNALGNTNQRQKSFTLERKHTTNIFQNQTTNKPSFLQNNNTNKTTNPFHKQANIRTNTFQKQQAANLFQKQETTNKTNLVTNQELNNPYPQIPQYTSLYAQQTTICNNNQLNTHNNALTTKSDHLNGNKEPNKTTNNGFHSKYGGQENQILDFSKHKIEKNVIKKSYLNKDFQTHNKLKPRSLKNIGQIQRNDFKDNTSPEINVEEKKQNEQIHKHEKKVFVSRFYIFINKQSIKKEIQMLKN
ncbi:hypothetical protein M0812_21311 [Anaeramoeba flamelloides]|uniref:Uncharacterized protein n=1 Tax=Anaeramoeba flamelloides TaxID=1746091 RepID=A0AAV7YRI2_9EUKA|nr:hypothetical protein M0812_21311 [Anaeramoeba flamelloides]